MSTSSPPQSGGSCGENGLSPSEGSACGGSNSGKSSGLNLAFSKDFTQRKATKEGQPQKRRGPKPDAKPAATRRQQLNRQAQRSHRERKEMHMHELELQVIYDKHLRLELVREKNAVEEENRLLKQILDHHGIAYPSYNNKPNDPSLLLTPEFNSADGTDPTALSASAPLSFVKQNKIKSRYSEILFDPGFNFTNGTNPIPTSPSENRLLSLSEPTSFSPDIEGGLQIIQLQDGSLDYVEVSLNFVLKLEETCRGHTSEICVPGQYNPKATLNGHTLMASWGSGEDRVVSAQLLEGLLEMSCRLELQGEITAIMAWAYISKHTRFAELTHSDFGVLGDELKTKTRCYGFGAALELFEVEDALDDIFTLKPIKPCTFPGAVRS